MAENKATKSKQKRIARIVGAAMGIVVAACVAFIIIFMSNPFEFSENEDGTYTLIHCDRNVTQAKIPQTYKEQPVTKIEESAFLGCADLISVEIPSGVTEISNFAFQDCVSLTSITIPNSVTKIGYNAFGGCTSLTSVIFEDDSRLKSIDVYAFEDCAIEFAILPAASILGIPKKHLKEVTITSGKSISAWAFANCKNLKTVTIKDHITEIGDGAFSDCISLETVVIGNNVRKIGNYTFSGCTSLTSVIFGDKNRLISIGEWAFDCCTSLTSITILQSVMSIGSYAFSDCSALASINYCGSKTQWRFIAKGAQWNRDAGAYTITYDYKR